MEEGKVGRGHIDLVLLDWLRRDGVAEAAKACYVYPSLGGYFEHQSDCDPKNFGDGKTRPAGWETRSNTKGTRVEDDDDKGCRGKFLITWKGEAENTRPRVDPVPERRNHPLQRV